MTLSRNKTLLLFVPIWIATGIGAIYVARQAYIRLMMPNQITRRYTISPNEPLSLPHPVYGRITNSGVFDITITVPQTRIPYRFRVVSDELGYRTTSEHPLESAGRPSIWVFGCSFTWGMAVDNDKVYPWLLQERFPEFEVKNYGVYAYGNVHALLQLRQLLEQEGQAAPEMVVFAYNSFHKKRNVAAPSWLRPESLAPNLHPDMRYPRASLRDGDLEVDLVSFQVPDSAEDPPPEERDRVTKAIFLELSKLCRAHGIKPVLGIQSLTGSDPVPDYCRDELGFTVSNMHVSIKQPIYNVLPYNSHPSAQAHRVYAEKLTATLEELLDS